MQAEMTKRQQMFLDNQYKDRESFSARPKGGRGGSHVQDEVYVLKKQTGAFKSAGTD